MKRRRRILGLVLVLVSMAAAGVLLVEAQWGGSDGFVVSDLELISVESRPEWGGYWTGPIQAATISSWFAHHGYPALLGDRNDDGVIDKLDTIHLADFLGLIESLDDLDIVRKGMAP